MRRPTSWLAIATLAMSPLLLPNPQPEQPAPHPNDTVADQPRPASGQDAAISAFRDLPTPFVQNHGQWPEQAKFRMASGPLQVWFEDAGWTVQLSDRSKDTLTRQRGRLTAKPGPGDSTAFRMSLVDPHPDHTIAGVDRLPGHHNYYLGKPQTWASKVPLFGKVRYSNVYTGVDLLAYAKNGTMEYDVCVRPGGDLQLVVFRCDGISGMRLASDGSLVMDTALGEVAQKPPITWQTVDGKQQPITCRYVVLDQRHFGFAVDDWDEEHPLTIDPGITWSTFLGSTGADFAADVALMPAPSSNVVIAGSTTSAAFPTTVGTYQTAFAGTSDCFVTQMAPSGTGATQLVFSTFIGGTSSDWVAAIGLDATNNVTVCGGTDSGSFAGNTKPVNDPRDGYVLELAANLGTLNGATRLGGNSNGRDEAYDLVMTSSGNPIVVGETYDSGFPVTAGAMQGTIAGSSDAFVVRANTSASALTHGTFYGGSGGESATGVALDRTGRPVVCGNTSSSNLPLSTAPATPWQSSNKGGWDGFVMVLGFSLANAGSNRAFGSYLGGNSNDWPNAIAVDLSDVQGHPFGYIVIAGQTFSTNLPTPNWTAPAGWSTINEGFLIRGKAGFAAAFPSAITHGTMIGSSGNGEAINDVHADATGRITVVGSTSDSGGVASMPITSGAYQTVPGTGLFACGFVADGFVARIWPDLASTTSNWQEVVYCSYLGGSAGTCPTDYHTAVKLDLANRFLNSTMVGASQSTNYPTSTGAYSTTKSTGWDAVATTLDLLPTGCDWLGSSTVNGANGQPILLEPRGGAKAGATSFTLLVANAPPSSGGALVWSVGSLTVPANILGANVFVNLATPNVTIPVASDGKGFTSLRMTTAAIPAAGTPLGSFQSFWVDPSNNNLLNASNGLTIASF